MPLDLKGKFTLVIVIGALALLANIAVVTYETSHMNSTVAALEITEDLYNTILEMRRYEKNFLLYQDRESIEQTILYYERAKEALAGLRREPNPASKDASYQAIGRDLEAYQSTLERLRADPRDPNAANEIRAIGKNLVDLPESMLRVDRRRVARAGLDASLWPLIIMGSMLVLFVVGMAMMNAKVVRPLVGLERATEKIAHGDFSPIPHAGKVESQVDRLVRAFNRMAQELETSQEQIIHSRKIASLGTLVSGIAHELNNPINNIILTIDTLVEGSNVDAARRKVLLDDILQQALRSSEIVKNLLDFSRAETAVFKELDPAQVLRETLSLVSNQVALSKVRVHEEIAGSLPRIVGNRQGLQQVFLNLIVNAIQAMPEGGDLTLRAQPVGEREIEVQVVDTGQGIPEENLSAIFDPFFTTKEVGKGTGLGLSVSYGVIKKHGGQIQVASRVGKGTTFTVTLPVREMVANA
jgi:signal transduction histidine kinase